MRPRVSEPRVVVEAARRCFAEKGFGGADMDDIARAAGISRATVYRYAGGRRALLRDVLLQEFGVLMEAIAQAADAAPDGREALRGMVVAAVSSWETLPVLARAAGPDLRDVLAVLTVDGTPLLSRLTALTTPIIERVQARGAFLPVPAAAVAEELVRFVLGLMHTPTLAGDGRDPAAAGRRALALFGPLLLAGRDTAGHGPVGSAEGAAPDPAAPRR